MKQKDLEDKVRELFERQGFTLEQEGNKFRTSGKDDLTLKVFSAEEYSVEDLKKSVGLDEKIFIDEGLEDIRNIIDNDVSVLREEEEEEEFDTPSYEVIGDIAVINDLAGVDSKEAVEGILHYQNVKTILLKKKGLSGEFRVGDYKRLYGKETETIHKEFGYEYKVDPTKVYFSERFGTERERVADQIDEGEKVLVMFAGVGPFAFLCSEKADKVVAVEKNPDAAAYLSDNIRRNNIENVEALEGDVRNVVPELEEFDRIIMPLPGMADKFLGLAVDHLSDNGVIHYYRFRTEGNWAELEKEIERIFEDKGFNYKILDRVECGDRGPASTRICIDLKVTKSI